MFSTNSFKEAPVSLADRRGDIWNLWLRRILCGCTAIEFDATVNISPFELDDGRIVITIEFKRPDGSRRTVRTRLDSGNPDFQISSTLARDLKLRLKPVSKGFNPGYGPSNVAAARTASSGTRSAVLSKQSCALT